MSIKHKLMSSPCSRHHSLTFYHLLLLLGHCSPPPSSSCRPGRLGRFCSWCFGSLLGCRWLGHSLWSLLLHPIPLHQVYHCSSKVHLLSQTNWIWKKNCLVYASRSRKNHYQVGQNQVGQLHTSFCQSYFHGNLSELIFGLLRWFLASEALTTFADLRFRQGFTC